ncbi:MAG TPA: AraC family transcriptional regulator, partial [Phycisphaeraceae bacterium]
MAESPSKPAVVGAAVVQAVLLVDLYERPEVGHRIAASSLPGHLIQLVINGRTTHEVSGRRYQMGPGSLIWYHEDETVRGVVHEAPWRYYTLNFIAPALSPPPFEARVRRVGQRVFRRFEALLRAWRDEAAPRAVREMRVQSALLALLADLAAPVGEPYSMAPSARLWWELETRLRQDLSRRIDLAWMAAVTGKSQATIARSCRAAVGLPPLKRVKQIRMSLARGLVERSDLRIKEIADRVGYRRVQEFSRDYRKHFGHPPTAQRAPHA